MMWGGEEEVVTSERNEASQHLDETTFLLCLHSVVIQTSTAESLPLPDHHTLLSSPE